MVNLQNVHNTHNHSIIIIKDNFNEFSNKFLVYDDTVWNCMLFPNCRDSINNETYIADNISKKFGINKNSIKIEYKGSKISKKISKKDNNKKTYFHKFFLVIISDFPKYMKNDEFIHNGKTYHWKTIIDLESDNNVMNKNEDVLSFIKTLE